MKWEWMVTFWKGHIQLTFMKILFQIISWNLSLSCITSRIMLSVFLLFQLMSYFISLYIFVTFCSSWCFSFCVLNPTDLQKVGKLWRYALVSSPPSEIVKNLRAGLFLNPPCAVFVHQQVFMLVFVIVWTLSALHKMLKYVTFVTF